MVLVHGTTAEHSRWNGVVEGLKDHFTVYAMDRRGRGLSGDGPVYDLQREVEDVAALVDGIPEGPVDLIGHSYGGLCALEAMALTNKVRKLLLYEPSLPDPNEPPRDPAIANEVRDLVERGEKEKALDRFYTVTQGISPEELAKMRFLTDWGERVKAAHTIPRELGISGDFRLDEAALRRWNTPTLVLIGGASPPRRRAVAERLTALIPDSRIGVLPGQQHMAMTSAPVMLAAAIREFCQITP